MAPFLCAGLFAENGIVFGTEKLLKSYNMSDKSARLSSPHLFACGSQCDVSHSINCFGVKTQI